MNLQNLHVFPNADALNRAVARRIEEIVRKLDREGAGVNLVLSGGRTPEGLYRTMAEAPYVEEICWNRLRIFFGDERCVPPDHEESNYRTAASALLNRVPVQPDRIHRIHGELGAAAGARHYENLLEGLLGMKEEPWFDIVLLGLGSDGHTASIFPSQTLRPDQVTRRVVSVTEDHPPGPERITLTPRALNSARFVFFLVKGLEKSAVLGQLVSGPDLGARFPASLIRPVAGRVEFFADEGAASGIP